jgi:hypothetical protein
VEYWRLAECGDWIPEQDEAGGDILYNHDQIEDSGIGKASGIP